MKKIRQQIGVNATLLNVVEQFLKTADQYAKSSIRKHRANLLEYSYQEWLAEQLTKDDFEQCVNLLKSENAPETREDLEDRTSAKKAKSVTAKVLEKLRDHLKSSKDPTDYFLFQMISELCFFFCRPSELMTMKVIGNDVIFTNAKATNGRACGEIRTFKNAAKVDGRRKYLERFTADLNSRILEAGGWETLSQALSSRLARRCRKLKIKRLSFYTFRHAGIATAKSIFPVEELAALAGHASNRTAITNYAKRRSGLKIIADKMTYSASEENVTLVRKHDNWKRPSLPKRILPAIQLVTDLNQKAADTDVNSLEDDASWIPDLLKELDAKEVRERHRKKRLAELEDDKMLAQLASFVARTDFNTLIERNISTDTKEQSDTNSTGTHYDDKAIDPIENPLGDVFAKNTSLEEEVGTEVPDPEEPNGPKF